MLKFILVLMLSVSNAFALDTVNINGASNLIVYGQEYTSTTGHCLVIKNSSNVTILNSRFTKCLKYGVAILASTNITIKDSYFDKAGSGVSVTINSSGVRILDNRFLNLTAVGFLGHAVQFNAINSAGNMVVGNYVLEQPTIFKTSDAINLYNSGGVPGSPLLISNNKISGGNDPSGVGILVGDGPTPGSYIDVRDNLLINSGQAAVAIGGGHNINVIGNMGYGMSQAGLTWIGMYSNSLRNPYANPPTNDPDCHDILFENNSMDWTNKYNVKSNFVDTGECTNVTQVNNNFDPLNDLSFLNFNFWEHWQ
jgi:hypothetical protein